MAELGISKESVCFIIFKAREFEEIPGSGLVDEGFGGAVVRDNNEIKQFIESIDLDEQCDVVALAWVGRGDFDLSEWAEARELARERHNERTAEYLLGMPLLADYLQAGLDVFGISCEDIEEERL